MMADQTTKTTTESGQRPSKPRITKLFRHHRSQKNRSHHSSTADVIPGTTIHTTIGLSSMTVARSSRIESITTGYSIKRLKNQRHSINGNKTNGSNRSNPQSQQIQVEDYNEKNDSKEQLNKPSLDATEGENDEELILKDRILSATKIVRYQNITHDPIQNDSRNDLKTADELLSRADARTNRTESITSSNSIEKAKNQRLSSVRVETNGSNRSHSQSHPSQVEDYNEKNDLKKQSKKRSLDTNKEENNEELKKTISTTRMARYQNITHHPSQTDNGSDLKTNDRLSSGMNFQKESREELNKKIRKRGKVAGNRCRCSRLCIFLSISAGILLATAVAAILISILTKSGTTTKLAPRMTMSTTDNLIISTSAMVTTTIVSTTTTPVSATTTPVSATTTSTSVTATTTTVSTTSTTFTVTTTTVSATTTLVSTTTTSTTVTATTTTVSTTSTTVTATTTTVSTTSTTVTATTTTVSTTSTTVTATTTTVSTTSTTVTATTTTVSTTSTTVTATTTTVSTTSTTVTATTTMVSTTVITTTTSTTVTTTTTTDTTTTTTETTTTDTTTTTTETTTITYVPTGIFALEIPPCAKWNDTGITVAGNANGTAGTDIRSLNTTVSIFIDNNYTLYVCDRENHRIMKYEVNATTGTIIAGNGAAGDDPSQLNEPKGVAVDQMGAIVVADSLNYRIQKFPLGSTIGTTIAINSSSNLLGETRDLHIDVNNAVYVTDSNYSRIVKYYPNNGIGVILAGSSGPGSAADQFFNPYGNFMDGNNTLYVADFGNHRVQKWLAGATSGITVAGVNCSSGSTLAKLNKPIAVIVDNNGYIYIADQGNHRIVRWTNNYAAGGTCIVGCNGSSGATAVKLKNPRDLKFDASGNLYVSDQGNNRIQKFMIQYPSNCTYTSG